MRATKGSDEAIPPAVLGLRIGAVAVTLVMNDLGHGSLVLPVCSHLV
jgi:hypothetical protein